MGLLCLRSKSLGRFKMSVNVCLGDCFLIRGHFFTKFCMMMQHHEPKCHVGTKNFFWGGRYLQGQGHSKGSYDENITLFNIFSELLIPLQPNLVS